MLDFVVVVTGAGADDVVTAGTETGLDVVLGSAGGSTLVVVTGTFVVVSGVEILTEVSKLTSAEELLSSALRARAPRFLW